jgi:hypothetical protein
MNFDTIRMCHILWQRVGNWVNLGTRPSKFQAESQNTDDNIKEQYEPKKINPSYLGGVGGLTFIYIA